MEIAAIDPSTNNTVVIRMASAGAGPKGTLVNGVQWKPAIIDGPDDDYSRWSNGQPQPLDVSYGPVSFAISKVFDNAAWTKYVFDGAFATIWIGDDKNDNWASYRQLWSGSLGPMERSSDDTAKISRLGPLSTLQRNLLSANYQGTGNAEGPSSLLGAIKPWAIGSCVNVEGVLIDPIFWIYQVDGYDACTVTAIYENALILDPAKNKGNFANYGALKAATVEVGEWATCPAQGLYRLGAEPTGKITANIGAGATVGSTITALMGMAGIQPAKIGSTIGGTTTTYRLYAREQVTILDAIREAASAAGKYLTCDASGTFHLADHVSTKAPIALTSNQSSRPYVLPDTIRQEVVAAPAWRVKVGHTRVWSPHSLSEISPAIATLGADLSAAQAAAEAAQDTADAANEDAKFARQRVDNQALDGVLDRTEKLQLVAQIQSFTAERTGLVSTGNGLANTTEVTAYSNAYTTLINYLNALSPAYTDTAKDTTVDGNFAIYIRNYLTAKQNLTNANFNKAKTTAQWTNVEDRPTDLPDLDPVASGKLDGIEDGATVGAPEGTNIGDRTVKEVLEQLERVATGGFSDTTPPPIPTGLAVSSIISDAGATLTATWNASVADDLAGYEIGAAEGAAEPYVYPTSATKWERTGVKRNVEHRLKVRSYDKAGNRSNWSSIVVHTTDRDAVAPALATGLAADATFEAINLRWTNPSDSDLVATEVWANSTNASGSARKLVTLSVRPSSTSSYIHTVGDPNAVLYYWLRTVDSSGNTSGFTAGIGPLKTVLVDISDVAPAVAQGIIRTVTSLPPEAGYTGPTVVLNSADGKLYRFISGKWTAEVSVTDFDELITEDLIDTRGLDIRAPDGVTMFGSDGRISDRVAITMPNGSNISLSTIAANALTPSLHYVGEFSSLPTQAQLGAEWRQNAVYKNSVDARSYVLTGDPLVWQLYLVDGQSWSVVIESSNGTTFRVGQSTSTLLTARIFKNGAEVSSSIPEGWIKWRRVSGIPRPSPNDDATFNAKYASGYKSIMINIDDIYSRATFFVDVNQPT